MYLLEGKKEIERLDDFIKTHLINKYPGRIKVYKGVYNYTGGLEMYPNVWPEVVSSLENLLDNKQISNPGFKKIQNNNWEYHIRGQYKAVISWEESELTKDSKKDEKPTDNQRILILKAIGHSAKIMPVMNSL